MSKFHFPEISAAQLDQLRQLLTVAIDYCTRGFSWLALHLHPLAAWLAVALVGMAFLWLVARLFLFAVKLFFYVILPAIVIAILALTLTPFFS